ncbi:MAG: FAD/NAD(P)-binding protein, partial [Sphingomicrobium sp.]
MGGGFSGTMLAAELARRGIAAVLIDGTKRSGRGVAYSTGEPAHLLNVRAEAMSAWADAPDHFAKWFGQRGGDPRGFAPRQSFGVYLRDILDDAVAGGQVEVIERAAIAATPGDGGWTVELDDGRALDCAALILANGNQPPEPLGFAAAAGARMINNPWGAEAQAAVRAAAGSGGDVLLIGTGLTMVDLVLSLDAAGHRGTIVALSRRGLIPRGHADFAPAPAAIEDVPRGNALALWRWLRRRAGAVGWRAAVDALRPHSQTLWQGLPAAEQRRFLRHARPWWDVHRHRIAPEISARLAQLVGEGRLEVRAGRIAAMRDAGDGVEVTIDRRGQRGTVPAKAEKFAFAFNCTGPLGALARSQDPLLRGLLDAGAIRPDALGMGIAVDPR